jgi:DNA-binding PadR family transcriptional regulator
VRRRKVGNLLALAILGTLWQRPMHPYEMATTLREQGKDQDMPIKWGSLYTVVRNLEKHGFIAAVGNSRAGARPERTTYEITPAGKEELKDWVKELLGTPEREQTNFRAALSMLGALTPTEATELLRQRVATLKTQLKADREHLTTLQVHRLFLVEDEYDLAIREAELTWTQNLLTEFETGDFPGLETWHQFHQRE